LRFTIVQLEVVGQRSFRARCSHARQAAAAQRPSLGGAPLHDGADQTTLAFLLAMDHAQPFEIHGRRKGTRMQSCWSASRTPTVFVTATLSVIG